MSIEVPNRPEMDEKPIDVHELPPPDVYDPVIEAYKKDVDRTLLRENLKLTVEGRVWKFQSFLESIEAWREAGRRMRFEDKRDSSKP